MFGGPTSFWLVVKKPSWKNMKVNGKDCPIYEMEKNMFETTNQNNKVIGMPKCSMVTLMGL